MRVLPVLCVLLLAAPAAAADRQVTFYLDGARVESEAVATRGYLEFPLPRGMAAGSLRIRPLQGASLARVEVAPVRPDRKVAVELAHLTERKEALADRLRALAVREEIFRAAAKSQSAKAPRKTKNNREPLDDIRKGTEFAIAQLEGVYRARRKAEGELKVLEARLSSLGEGGNAGESVARVWLAGKGGRVAVSYLHAGLKWTPCYDFRVTGGGEVEVVMNAVVPGTEKGTVVAVVPALLGEAAAEPPLAAAAGGLARIASFSSPLEDAQFTPFPQPAISFSFRNRSGKRLPPGEATCYRKGEYLGKTAFGGSLPGESRELACGKMPQPAR
ncbi:MAG: hypothetical protein NDI77_00340 [Geobacteraceae bacterium]|nr:hypothetical protein [Geobacteraceae bacterium]